MCAGCAMTAAAGATGFRTWLQVHHPGWLTARRLRALTAAAVVAATLVSSVGISGSSPAQHARSAPAPARSARP